jgi:NADP-dependent 3-hydroxy acid dehydrogenase YdfG
MSNITGKVVGITGASSGIGEAMALLLVERGANVVLGARGLDRLEALAARIKDVGGNAAFVRTDVRRRDDLSKRVVNEVTSPTASSAACRSSSSR